VNIGAYSGKNDLPEPTGQEVMELVIKLQRFTQVIFKPNIRRLFND